MTDNFKLKELKHTKYLFTKAELAKLLKYGTWATDLNRGVATPNSSRQNHFVAVCRGETEPQTDFEFLWCRYKETITVDEAISRYQNEATTIRVAAIAASEQTQIEIKCRDDTIKKLGATLSSYERKLGINQPEPRDPSDKYNSNVDAWREQP
jgi:uncharacterized protein YifE (UPF0438 family)